MLLLIFLSLLRLGLPDFLLFRRLWLWLFLFLVFSQLCLGLFLQLHLGLPFVEISDIALDLYGVLLYLLLNLETHSNNAKLMLKQS